MVFIFSQIKIIHDIGMYSAHLIQYLVDTSLSLAIDLSWN